MLMVRGQWAEAQWAMCMFTDQLPVKRNLQS